MFAPTDFPTIPEPRWIPGYDNQIARFKKNDGQNLSKWGRVKMQLLVQIW